MSIRWIQAAFEAEEVPMVPRLVLIAIADYANESGEAWPSVMGIAKKIGGSTRTVTRSIQTLERMGVIQARRSLGCRTTYQLKPVSEWNPRQAVTSDRESPVTESTGTPDRESLDPRQRVTGTSDRESHKPSRTVIEPSGDPSGGAAAFPTSNCKTWTPPQDLIESLKAAFPNLDIEAELKKALAWCIANPAKRKKPTGMGRFLNGWMRKAQSDADKLKASGKMTNAERHRQQSREWAGEDGVPFYEADDLPF